MKRNKISYHYYLSEPWGKGDLVCGIVLLLSQYSILHSVDG